jgi:ATP-binding cassette subfamily B protein
VSFSYPGSERLVLDGLDLELPVGRCTAIVGVNGAGKTTLVKLLTRLHDPTAGRITADGIAIDDFDVRAWRRQVSVIFQDFVRYELTAADNIALGAAYAPRDETAVRRAAERAGALGAFSEHPQGLATMLGRGYEGGVDLSGGQWQRLAIARSLYALSAGAKLLVLDEPTSALDVRAEAAFFDSFVELTRGVTSILISHRFSSVRRADNIVVIEGGRVIEQGDHDELLAAGRTYSRLFNLQAERFAAGLDAEVEEEVA